MAITKSSLVYLSDILLNINHYIYVSLVAASNQLFRPRLINIPNPVDSSADGYHKRKVGSTKFSDSNLDLINWKPSVSLNKISCKF